MSRTFLACNALVPCLAICALSGTARALSAPLAQVAPDPASSGQQAPIPGPGDSTSASGTGPSPFEPGFTTGLFSASRPSLLGNLYGVRTALGRYGVSLGLQETDELFGNPVGGLHQGASYDGLTTLSLGVDTAKAFGVAGGIFNVTALQIHGRFYGFEDQAALQPVSGIQALRSTRLWEMWYQQSAPNGALDVKMGQQSLDQEFMGSQYAALFLNAAMGWPVLASSDQYAGGPAYPLASLGVRVRFAPLRNVTVLAGVFDDNAGGGPFFTDFQVRGAAQSGTAFSLGTGALAIGELQYASNQPVPGDMDRGGGSGLPRTFKLGFWYDSATFPDPRLDAAGVPLAGPFSNRRPRSHRGNYSAYALADRMVWRPDPGSPRSVDVFARVMGAPGDRNAVDFSLNAGVTLKAPLPGRDNDTVGLGYGIARVSSSISGFDRDTAALGGGNGVRSSESFLEVSYQYQAAPWLLVQPDFQYVYNPALYRTSPGTSGRRVGNEAVFGVRTNIAF